MGSAARKTRSAQGIGESTTDGRSRGWLQSSVALTHAGARDGRCDGIDTDLGCPLGCQGSRHSFDGTLGARDDGVVSKALGHCHSREEDNGAAVFPQRGLKHLESLRSTDDVKIEASAKVRRFGPLEWFQHDVTRTVRKPSAVIRRSAESSGNVIDRCHVHCCKGCPTALPRDFRELVTRPTDEPRCHSAHVNPTSQGTTDRARGTHHRDAHGSWDVSEKAKREHGGRTEKAKSDNEDMSILAGRAAGGCLVTIEGRSAVDH